MQCDCACACTVACLHPECCCVRDDSRQHLNLHSRDHSSAGPSNVRAFPLLPPKTPCFSPLQLYTQSSLRINSTLLQKKKKPPNSTRDPREEEKTWNFWVGDGTPKSAKCWARSLRGPGLRDPHPSCLHPLRLPHFLPPFFWESFFPGLGPSAFRPHPSEILPSIFQLAIFLPCFPNLHVFIFHTFSFMFFDFLSCSFIFHVFHFLMFSIFLFRFVFHFSCFFNFLSCFMFFYFSTCFLHLFHVFPIFYLSLILPISQIFVFPFFTTSSCSLFSVFPKKEMFHCGGGKPKHNTCFWFGEGDSNSLPESAAGNPEPEPELIWQFSRSVHPNSESEVVHPISWGAEGATPTLKPNPS